MLFYIMLSFLILILILIFFNFHPSILNTVYQGRGPYPSISDQNILFYFILAACIMCLNEYSILKCGPLGDSKRLHHAL